MQILHFAQAFRLAGSVAVGCRVRVHELHYLSPQHKVPDHSREQGGRLSIQTESQGTDSELFVGNRNWKLSLQS